MTELVIHGPRRSRGSCRPDPTPNAEDHEGWTMGQVISGMTSALEADPLRLSLAMRAWARLALLWPPIQARFAEDWRQASSVAAKGYATPRFLGVSALWVPVDWVLEKNRDEEDAYLEMLGAEDSKLGQTHYIQEIQIRKHGRDLDSA